MEKGRDPEVKLSTDKKGSTTNNPFPLVFSEKLLSQALDIIL